MSSVIPLQCQPAAKEGGRTLQEGTQDLASRLSSSNAFRFMSAICLPSAVSDYWALEAHLQQRVPSHDLEEPLQALAAQLDGLGRETVGEDLAGERRDVDL